MANQWHVNPETGNPGRCRVDWSNPKSRGCPHGFGEQEHFENAGDAVRYYSERREAQEDPFRTVTAAEEELAALRAPAPAVRPLAQDGPQYLSSEVGQKSFWGRNGRKIGGAVVAAFAIATITSLVVNQGSAQEPDGVAPQGDDAVVQEDTTTPLEEPLPSLEEPEDSGDSARELGTEVSERLKETGERIGEQVTPERVDKLKEAGQGIKDFFGGIIDGTGVSVPTISVPVEVPPIEVSEGVQFQGKSMEPSAQEIADAQATLAQLEIASPKTDAYYNRAEQFGRSFQTGVVGRLEHRDIPQATFKNDAPQARAIGGSFIDPYTGDTVEVVKGSSTDTDVDHIVTLKEVVLSESDSRPLSQDDRVSIANDFDNLQVTGSSMNRRKGAKDPGAWMPPNQASHLRYAIATINVKSKYGLTVDQAEHDVLAQVLATRQ